MRTLVTLLCALTIASGQEKQRPPEGGPPKPFTVPARQTNVLKNGAAITLVPYGRVPKITISAYLRAGNINEGPKQVWLADALAKLMKEGAGSLNAEQLAQAAARMGGEISVSAGPDQTVARIEALSEFAPEAARLLADVLQRPVLPESELPRIKKDLLRQVAVGRSTAQGLADEAFARALYGDHPYGRYYPTEDMINAFTIADVRRFYHDNFGAARTHVYVAGNFDPAAGKAVAAAFETWPRGPDITTNVPKPAARKQLVVIERPNAPQSTVRIGLPVLNPKDPDYIPMLVMNAILGGSFNSRITANIREQKGYTYSPFSMVATHYLDGYWAEEADVTTAVTGAAIREIINEIDRMRKEPPTDDELKGIKNYLAGTFVLRNSSRNGIIGQLAFVDLQGLGDQFLRNYVQRVYAVTGADVQRMAEKYLDPGKMALVVVGDKAKVSDQLKEFEP